MADDKSKIYDKPMKINKLPMFNRYSGKPEWVDNKPVADKLQWSVLNDTYLSFTVFLKGMEGMINHSIYLTEFKAIMDKVSESYLNGKDETLQYNLTREFFNGGSKTTVNTSVLFGMKEGVAWVGFVREGLRKVKFDFDMVGSNELVVVVKDDKKVVNLSPYIASGYFSNLFSEAMKTCVKAEPEYLSSKVGNAETVTSKKEPETNDVKEISVEDKEVPF